MKMVILAAGLGTRVREVSGGLPKALLDLGRETLLDRWLGFARDLDLEPVLVTRPEMVARFPDLPGEILTEDEPTGLLASLYHVREALTEPFAWAASDMVFSDLAPLADMVRGYDPSLFCSLLYCRSDRFKAKITFDPLRVTATRVGSWPYSIPNFVVQSPRSFPYMDADQGGPESLYDGSNFLQRGIEAGEPVAYREYSAEVFEIDTPRDLAEARAFFAR
jgi:NDP-sugar pyrophosphorylase family protein